MADTHIILLPKDSYGDWLDGVKDYAMKFGINFTNDPATASKQTTVTLVTPANPLEAYDEDMAAWLLQTAPGVKVDVVTANTPAEARTALAARVAANDQLAGARWAAPAASPAPVAAPSGPKIINGLSGALQMKSDKGRYAAKIENIQFTETIKNHTGNTIKYTYVGVKGRPVAGGQEFFHTSWNGDLSLGPNCTGPRDSCGGPWDDSCTIATPGQYRLTLEICFGGDDWQTLTEGIEIEVVEWTPS